MKKYKLWLNIEEIDEDNDYYQDLEEHTCSIGCEFDTQQQAINLKNSVVEFAANYTEHLEYECDNTHEQNGTVCRSCWDGAVDVCPICQSDLTFGPNGCTICSKDGCLYWRW